MESYDEMRQKAKSHLKGFVMDRILYAVERRHKVDMAEVKRNVGVVAYYEPNTRLYRDAKLFDEDFDSIVRSYLQIWLTEDPVRKNFFSLPLNDEFSHGMPYKIDKDVTVPDAENRRLTN